MEEPPPKKSRQGVQKRVQAATSSKQSPPSQLAQLLLQLLAWGAFTPQRVQSVAALCIDDMKRIRDEGVWFDDLEAISKSGTSGQHSNNVHRDLMSKVGNMSKLQEPFVQHLHFAEPFGDATQSFLLPHETFAAIYNHYPEFFKKAVVPSTEHLKQFWQEVDDHPLMLGHPVKQRAEYNKWAVPLSLHGDGVPVTGIGKVWLKLMTVFSFSSLVAVGSTKDIQLFIWGVFDRLCVTGVVNTLDEFFELLKWSFYWLWLGVWPDKPWNSDIK